MTDKTLPPVDRHALTLAHTDVESSLNRLRDQLCTTPEAREFFVSMMNLSHTKHADFVQERQLLTKPLKAEIEDIESPYRPLLKALDDLKKLSKSKVSEYDTSVALAAEASRTRAIEAAQQGNTTECSVALSEIPDEVPSSMEWVVSQYAADLVPRKFLEVSERLLKNYCIQFKNSDMIPEVDGVVFERRVLIRVKGK